MLTKLKLIMNRTKKTKSIDGPNKSDAKENKPLKIEDDGEFVVHHIEEEEESSQPSPAEVVFQESKVVANPPQAAEKVKVSFENFVQLVANHNYEAIIKKNKEESVIISSNVLADLANAHEEEEERRIPAIFIIGVVLGIVITYILLTF